MRVFKQYKGGGGAFLKELPGYMDATRMDLYDAYREGPVEIRGAKEEVELLSTLKVVDPYGTDTALLNRIIRNGGFSSYIEKLEG